MYSFDFSKFDQDSLALGRVEDVNASYKDCSAVCANIRKMGVKEALVYLEQAMNKQIAVEYKKYSKHMAHRKELGGKKGRYPVKTARIVYKLLKSTLANALRKGLDEDSLMVLHVSANKKHGYPRMQAVGRRTKQTLETCRVEVILLDLSYKPENKSKKTESKEEKSNKAKKAESKETLNKANSKENDNGNAKKEIEHEHVDKGDQIKQKNKKV